MLRKKRERKSYKKNKPKFFNKTLKVRNTRIKATKEGNKLIALDDSFICSEFISSNNITSSISSKSTVEIKLPSNFDIFKNTEDVVSCVIDISKKLMSPKLRHIDVDHRKVKKSSLGSESLLGLLVTEIISNRRSHRGEKISIRGVLPAKGKSPRTLIENIGLVKELSDDHFTDAQDNEHGNDIHYYRKDNKYAINVSVKEDNKSITADECVKYLNSCLGSHNLSLLEDAKNKIKACLGEVFDNAEEHCGRNKPVWFVRGYFNDVQKDRFLELSVFNLGNTFYDNFNNLPSDSEIKNKAMEYVNRHKNNTSINSLFTVASLQGAVSTKKDADDTRGHGSVTLIETFESLHDEYKKLRGGGSEGSNAEMNIISGETIIKFDGKYRSKTKQRDDGSETFIMPFNASQSLEEPPEDKYVYTMSKVKFPGVMINIRIPLQGSTVPLLGEGDE